MDALPAVEWLLGKPAQIDFHPMHRANLPVTWADIAKAEQLIGWRLQVSTEEGIGRLVAWCSANQAWARQVVTA